MLLGRRDAETASFDDANKQLPPANGSFSELLTKFFQPIGLNLKDLVVLSGGHTLGYAQCESFKGRLYNDTNIDPNFALTLKRRCPPTGGPNVFPFDDKPATVDTSYYTALLGKKGLLHSDQELYKGDGGESDKLVQLYSGNPEAFAKDFGASMIKMGNIKLLRRDQGRNRSNCRKAN